MTENVGKKPVRSRNDLLIHLPALQSVSTKCLDSIISLWMAIGSSRFIDKEHGIEFNWQDNSVGLMHTSGLVNTGRFWQICGKSGSTDILKKDTKKINKEIVDDDILIALDVVLIFHLYLISALYDKLISVIQIV